MKNNVIKAAGIQIFCNTSKQGMLEKAEKYIEQAIQNYPDIDLFVLPEQFYQMDCYEYENETYGEYEHGMFEEWLSQCAKKYHTNIIGGSYAVRPAKKSVRITGMKSRHTHGQEIIISLVHTGILNCLTRRGKKLQGQRRAGC